MAMSSQKRVRRRALACARCRLRKIMCDNLSPACTRCVEAGVSCVALDSTTKRSAPRSIAQYLETEIANRESHSSDSSPLNVHFKSTSGASKSSRDHRALSVADLVTKDFTPAFLGISAAVPFARCVVVGTRIPSTRLFGAATDIDENHPRSIINPLPLGTPLHSIPIEASKYLFDNYMSRVAAQYPIFYASDVVSYYRSVFHRSSATKFGEEASASEVYIISLIMAISLTTAARTQQARANSIASGLFKNAIRQIPTVLTNDFQGLQALLLLLQYAFLDPGAANIWLLSGFSIQACIDLGLHQELPPSSDVSVLTRDMRRRVFWCAYEMEIAVCAALLRPTSLLNKNINVLFPTEVDDSAISEAGIDLAGRPSKFTSHRIWKFRQIESEIVSVLFQNEEIPGEGRLSLEEWMEVAEKAINDWDEEVHRSAGSNLDRSMSSHWAEMNLYASIATPYIIVTLFRPCPRIREPTCRNLMKAFVAGVKVADGYHQQANLDFGNSKYVFHPCHHTFSSAVAFLQALQRCKDSVAESYILSEVEGFMGSFSRLFAIMAERWPAASRCLEEYERLMEPVKKDYIDFITQRARTHSVSHIPDLENLITFQGDLMDSTINLDDMFNFGSFFNPAGASTVDEYSWLYSPVPTNWNAEFDFEMNLPQ